MSWISSWNASASFPMGDEKHLDWSAKQSRILTDEGNALTYYSEERGFPFTEEELPHYHLERGDSHDTFSQWSAEFLSIGRILPIVGAWKRSLFSGKWEHSTDEDESVYNIQTSTLFVDLRIPRSKHVSKWETVGKLSIKNGKSNIRDILGSLSDYELREYARQHVFGGISVLSVNDADGVGNIRRSDSLIVCTRHHCIDWNYAAGYPRPRPNKWSIEGRYRDNMSFDAWNELSFASDHNGQSYYSERWERLSGDESGNGLRLALRKRCDNEMDGILVVVGDHFNYVIGRDILSKKVKSYANAKNAVELIDSAIQHGDRDTAITYLSLDGGHGTISSGWKIDSSIHSWKHGEHICDCIATIEGLREVAVTVFGSGPSCLTWKVEFGSNGTDHQFWDVYECSLQSASELESLFRRRQGAAGHMSRL